MEFACIYILCIIETQSDLATSTTSSTSCSQSSPNEVDEEQSDELDESESRMQPLTSTSLGRHFLFGGQGKSSQSTLSKSQYCRHKKED